MVHGLFGKHQLACSDLVGDLKLGQIKYEKIRFENVEWQNLQ